MKVKWLTKALLNLEAEAEYIAREVLDAAKQVVKNIHTAVVLLQDNPVMGQTWANMQDS